MFIVGWHEIKMPEAWLASIITIVWRFIVNF